MKTSKDSILNLCVSYHVLAVLWEFPGDRIMLCLSLNVQAPGSVPTL